MRNAFNSVSRRDIIEELKNRKVSSYMINLIQSYFTNREFVAQSGKWYDSNAGVPQGSVLGPILWNILYDGILRVRMPTGTQLIAFADDLVLVAAGKEEGELMRKANQALEGVCEWMEGKNLRIAAEKTEAILLTGRKKHRDVYFIVEGTRIHTQEIIKYLGITLDKHMSFGKHVEKTAAKATKAAGALARIMPRVGGAGEPVRKTLAAVAESIMLYAAPVWAEALEKKKYRQVAERVQRKMAIRICRGYRTISTAALQVLARQMPIDLAAKERKRAYIGEKNKTEVREETLQIWQERWEKEAATVQWTRRLIRDIKAWYGRTHGETDYQLTQFLSGHGCFKAYTCAIGKELSSDCEYCGELDTAEHTVFNCVRWTADRDGVNRKIGRRIGPENVVELMLETPENWQAIQAYITKTMEAKEGEERERQGK